MTKQSPGEKRLLAELGERLAKARITQKLTQEGLADAAAVSKRTIERLETGESVQLSNLVRVVIALDLTDNFEQLVPKTGPSPMELLRQKGKTRQRAPSSKPSPTQPWTWDDKPK